MPPTPRDASTVLLLRDGRQGLEVFMVKRSSELGFLGGHHVFPGGAVDPSDADPIYERFLLGFDAERVAERFGMKEPGRARAHVVAALRELFEESGILLAAPRGAVGSLAPTARYLQEARRRVARGELSFADFLSRLGVHLAADRLHYFAHWVTPESGSRRFDTRFFLARMPEGQHAEHDRGETIDGEWVRPADALARYARREIELVPPTICSLDRLRLHETVGEALEAARQLDVVEVIPRIVLVDGDVTILYPGDEDYTSESAGPAEAGKMLNRLILRDGLWVRP
ncbi:MAG: NUDIX domain-containing protein [Candidatus Dadabacteria bacterium]|nr:MAG: NUDIX domain-containing protein [Candidatus Dadabacteria bacterium]